MKTTKEIFFSRFNAILIQTLRAQEPPSIFDFITKNTNPYDFVKSLTSNKHSLATHIFMAIDESATLLGAHKNELLESKHFEDLPFIQNAIAHYLGVINQTYTDLSQKTPLKLLTDFPNPEKELLSRYKGEINQFCESMFGVKDKRLEIDGRMENVLLRRMDSLARLFSFENPISVCTAVTIFQGKLIFAYNAESEAVETKIKEAVDERLAELRNSVVYLAKTFRSIEHQFRLESTQIAQKLASSHGLHVKPEEFTQAYYKIAKELIFDADLLGLKSFILDANREHIVLTPSKIKKTFSKYQHYPMSAFHAEQMIKMHIEANEPSPGETITIGLSRLCCGTCWDAVKNPANPVQYIVSGTHQSRYTGVLDTSRDEREPQHPKRKIITNAKPSPGDTPGKKRKQKRNVSPESTPLESTDRCRVFTPTVAPLNFSFLASSRYATPEKNVRDLSDPASTQSHKQMRVHAHSMSSDLVTPNQNGGLLHEGDPKTQAMRVKPADSPMDSGVGASSCSNTPRRFDTQMPDEYASRLNFGFRTPTSRYATPEKSGRSLSDQAFTPRLRRMRDPSHSMSSDLRTPEQNACLLHETNPNTQALRLKPADSPMESGTKTPSCSSTPRSVFWCDTSPRGRTGFSHYHACTPTHYVPDENVGMERSESWSRLDFN